MTVATTVHDEPDAVESGLLAVLADAVLEAQHGFVDLELLEQVEIAVLAVGVALDHLLHPLLLQHVRDVIERVLVCHRVERL